MLFGRKKRAIVRLLIVEDEPLVAFDTEYFLTEEGFEIAATVDTVADAVAAIEREAGLHLVLVDVSLADGSGIDVARAAHRRNVPSLFVTGNCPGDVEGVAAGCLSKPYAQRDLLAAIGAIERVRGGKPAGKLPGGFRLFLRTDAEG